ncbi:hypothetical protein GCM10007938_16040 [Vibrio zhanjiangensis]|uniref:Uncharacterized protein n=1 Tax=Vibrio zhanjiangensis TaxID=1046128 RepID=A0ABQ6EZ64_9VIBR|nr:hypothetical protein [Vibrio zhanjiangensis]GLT17825.1 hypothetical protein GCM10007938_16030 [Vibrio zhanjiangensis]GLT17826.1 hypothetical protein GCM10007938_16040 [Vibrio zhanjiangensis]
MTTVTGTNSTTLFAGMEQTEQMSLSQLKAAVMHDRATETEENVRYKLVDMQQQTNEMKAINDVMQMLRNDISNINGNKDDSKGTMSAEVKQFLSDNVKGFSAQSEYTRADMQLQLDNVKAVYDNLASQGSIDMIRTNDAMSKNKNAVDAYSTIVKNDGDAKEGIIRNM